METRTIQHGSLSATVSQATTLMGMRRTLLQLEAQKAEAPEDDEALRILRTVIYPDLAAAMVGSEGFDLNFEGFCALPDKFVAKWEEAAYALNPHWQPGYSEAEEKKEPMTSASASPTGTSDSES